MIINSNNLGFDENLLDNIAEFMDTTQNIVDDEIYNDEEGIEETRKEMRENLEKSKEEIKGIKKELNDEEKIKQIAEYSCVETFLKKIKEQLDDIDPEVIKSKMDSIEDKESEEYKNLLNNYNTVTDPSKINIYKNVYNKFKFNYELIEDSLKLNILTEKIKFHKFKVNKEDYRREFQKANNKLSSSTKYQFSGFSKMKEIIESVIEDENLKKYSKTFMYYIFLFINNTKTEVYSTYYTFIINNIKYIKSLPFMEQNKIMIETLNRIFKTYFS